MKKYEVIPFDQFMTGEFRQIEEFVKSQYTKKSIKKIQKLSAWLWGVSASMTVKSQAFAATGNNVGLWEGTAGLFSIFQEIAMVIGALAIFGGLITMIFKKRIGQKVIMTAAIAIGGCFLVPSIIMLAAIIGTMLNDSLSTVFSNMNANLGR